MGEQKKVCFYIEDGYVKKVEGADTGDDPGPFEDATAPGSFEVKRMKSALASGCPAYIIICGRKYQI